MEKSKTKIEFGDFQTPSRLAVKMIDILKEKKIKPNIIVEPTCGIGEILFLAYKLMSPQKAIGVEINKEYVDSILKKNLEQNIIIIQDDIFHSIGKIQKEIESQDFVLFVGNPPWVTNSGVSLVNGNNLPQKENLKNLRGIDAITGKSNFDIAEYILLKLIERFHVQKSIFAFLCKTIVARNLLKYCWDNNYLYNEAAIYPINSKDYFGAAVDACFFIMDFTVKTDRQNCMVFDSIESRRHIKNHGYYKNKIIVDIDNFKSHNYLGKSEYIWRNGIKHDCSKIMELDITQSGLVNGYGEIVEIEDDLLYPLLKSSDVAKTHPKIRKKVIVTQKAIGQDTSYIRLNFPKTWKYLSLHQNDFDSRKSSIYKNKPPFSIFSIGQYSFMPYKIAISGLYKKLAFIILPPCKKRPVMVDDTCNFIACNTEAEAQLVYSLLTSKEAMAFLNSIIFWDSKRPITTNVLNSIDLLKIAEEIGLEEHFNKLCHYNEIIKKPDILQASLF